MGFAALVLREAPEAPYQAGPISPLARKLDHPRGPTLVRSAEDLDTPDPDRLEELGDEIAVLAAHLHAATHRMLVLIAEFDELGGWERAGHRTCAHWLAFRTGLDMNAAREKVRAARALRDLPLTSAAMARGRLSFSQVRALTRVATADNEGDLLELAEGCTTAQLERLARAWKKGSRQDEAEREREWHRSRSFSVFPDDDGMYAVKGRLAPEVGALLMRAIEAASDALYREERVPGLPGTEREAGQRRADAMALLAERALAIGFGGDEAKEQASPASACGGGPRPAPVSGTRAARYQVLLHVEPETLAAEGEPGRDRLQGARGAQLEDGVRVFS
jgi:hypothetical protein